MSTMFRCLDLFTVSPRRVHSVLLEAGGYEEITGTLMDPSALFAAWLLAKTSSWKLPPITLIYLDCDNRGD